jgi:cytochrome oxidase Cu insertion factor (SCO1/SenC/PrrC family)
MRRRIKVATTVALALFAAACAQTTQTPSGQGTTPITLGERAPAFSLRSASGETVSLSDYAGKPVLLYFSMGPG